MTMTAQGLKSGTVLGCKPVLHTRDLPVTRRSCRRLTRTKAVLSGPERDECSKEKVRTAWDIGRTAVVAALLATGLGAASPLLELQQPARADDEAFLSPYEKRRLDLQRRRDLLNAAREKALQQGSTEGAEAIKTEQEAEATAVVEDANKAREEEAARMRERLKAALQQYEERTKNAPKVAPPPAPPTWLQNLNKPKEEEAPAPAAPEAKPEPSPKVPSFSFSLPEVQAPKLDVPKLEAPKFEAPKFEAPKFELPKFEAPKFALPKPEPPKVVVPPLPVAPPPAPAPAAPESDFWGSLKSFTQAPEPKAAEPAKVEAPAPAKPAPKEAAKPAAKQAAKPAPVAKKEEAKASKKKGGLPLWLTELGVLGGSVAFLYASIVYSKEVGGAFTAATDALESFFELLFPTTKPGKH